MAYHKLRAAQPVIIRIERDLSMSKLGFQHNSVVNHEHRFVSKGSCSPTLGILSAQPSSTQAASAVQAVVAGRARVPLTSQSAVLYCSHLFGHAGISGVVSFWLTSSSQEKSTFALRFPTILRINGRSNCQTTDNLDLWCKNLLDGGLDHFLFVHSAGNNHPN